ncbi:glycosyltransferase [Pseudarthrobacter sp. NIBRBAC000502770]|uniref:glycosyltransferase n=1 Tax=Pseudarthrobacter sp. NIBRBAC000502770 TaxID=2590785 RepID=UPI0011404C52|nr:glycosyltransferase [Pseudarthrobacter sp. NIBRBAC000502770]QDG89418.1 glycosyltransferase family 1 protein [Pseudarthrobacter sp. NIBRBAC000502770]
MKRTTAAPQDRTVAIIGTRGYPSYYGGFETAVRKLAPYLAARGWNAVVYGRPGAARMDDPARDLRVQLVETKGLETKSLSTLTFGLTSVLHACMQKPDVAIIMNVANGFWLPLLRLRGIPTIVNVDGIEWERAKWGRLAKGVFKLGAHFTARFGTTLIADSVEISRRWKRDFDRESTFIPYGGDIPAELPLVDGLNHRGYVLIVARFVPENSVEEFFEAVPEIAKNFPVVIVGSSGYGGPLDDKAEALSLKHENVHWLGHVSDDAKLLSLWQHCGVYFHGHSVGGTNPALVQAMACGAPTLARDTVYNREVLGPHGRFTAVEPRDVVSSVLELAADVNLQAEASSNGLSRAATTYSWANVCRAYEEEAEKVLRSRHVPARS